MVCSTVAPLRTQTLGNIPQCVTQNHLMLVTRSVLPDQGAPALRYDDWLHRIEL